MILVTPRHSRGACGNGRGASVLAILSPHGTQCAISAPSVAVAYLVVSQGQSAKINRAS